MTTAQVLATTWAWDPSVLAGCAVLLVAYRAATQPPRGTTPTGHNPHGAQPTRGGALLFATGVLVLLLALVSPLDTLGDRYLFSAHMLQHLLLILVVPPLLLLGLPPAAAARLLDWAPARRVERVLSKPLLAWGLGTGVLWAWHLPALYDAALASPGLHVVQHLSFLVGASIFWWPVVAPVAERRRPPLVIVPYLITAGVANSILGVILTFAPPGLYPAYAHPVGTAALLAVVRHDWGLSYAADQQLGGLLMWVLGGPIYLVAGLGVLARWWGEQEDDIPTDQWQVEEVR